MTARDAEGILLQCKKIAETISKNILSSADNRTIRIVFGGIVDSITRMVSYIQIENLRGALSEFGRLTVLLKKADKALSLNWTQTRLGDKLEDIENDVQVLKDMAARASTHIINALEQETRREAA